MSAGSERPGAAAPDLETLWSLIETTGRSSAVIAACVRLVRGDLARIDLASPRLGELLAAHLADASAPCDALRTFSLELISRIEPDLAVECFRVALSAVVADEAVPGPLARAMARFLKESGVELPVEASHALLRESRPHESSNKRQERLAASLRAEGRDVSLCGNCGGDERVRVLEVVPKVVGGSDCSGNLVSLCHGCRARVPRLRLGAKVLAKARAAAARSTGRSQSERVQLALFGRNG